MVRRVVDYDDIERVVKSVPGGNPLLAIFIVVMVLILLFLILSALTNRPNDLTDQTIPQQTTENAI